MARLGIMNLDIKSKFPKLFGRTSAIEAEIDDFLDCITECGIIFKKAAREYLESGCTDEYEALVSQGSVLESRADQLRRDVEIQLYSHTLIPDLRGDVLSLLEHMDCLMNIYEGNLFRFSIQRPDIPPAFRKDFLDLAETAVDCVDSLVLAARSFFRDIEAVRDNNKKVRFFEHQADLISTRIQRAVFASDLALEQKTQLRYFVERIDELANEAEDVGDRLAIYAIKRRL